MGLFFLLCRVPRQGSLNRKHAGSFPNRSAGELTVSQILATKTPVLARALVNALASALAARPAAALLATPTAHLWSAGPANITPDNVVGDFTECNFVGYAAQALPALAGPNNLPSGAGAGEEGTVTFTAGVVVALQNALGYWIDDGGGHIYAAERFPGPVPFANAGDFLTLTDLFGVAYSVPCTF